VYADDGRISDTDAAWQWPIVLCQSRTLANRLTVEPDLQAVSSAFADLTDSELHALIDAIKYVPQIAPELLAWIEAACDWELNRRQGVECPLPRPPAASIHGEDAASIYTLTVIPMMFGERARGVHALFDALMDLLTGGGYKQ
jgi:hypothetical protein